MLPEIEIGQIWASFVRPVVRPVKYLADDLNERYLVVSRRKSDSYWEINCISSNKGNLGKSFHYKDFRGLMGTHFVAKWDPNINIDLTNYKPEPCVGQLWLGKILAIQRIIHKIDNIMQDGVIKTTDQTYLSRNTFNESYMTFVGWYDTSCITPIIIPEIDIKEYPHKCVCGAPAYIGLNLVDCSKKCKGLK